MENNPASVLEGSITQLRQQIADLEHTNRVLHDQVNLRDAEVKNRDRILEGLRHSLRTINSNLSNPEGVGRLVGEHAYENSNADWEDDGVDWEHRSDRVIITIRGVTLDHDDNIVPSTRDYKVRIPVSGYIERVVESTSEDQAITDVRNDICLEPGRVYEYDEYEFVVRTVDNDWSAEIS